MKITYVPSKDELIATIGPVRGKPNKKVGHFKLWWDREGTVRAFAITKYTEELEEFRKNVRLIKLGGMWKGTKITDQDIREARETLLRRLEEKW